MIEHKPEPWSSAIRNSCHEEIVLARLRIGYTRLTHSYLFQGLHAPPSCVYCNEVNLLVDHISCCPSLQNLRSIHGVPDSSPSALCNNSEKVSNSVNYLRSTYYFPLF